MVPKGRPRNCHSRGRVPTDGQHTAWATESSQGSLDPPCSPGAAAPEPVVWVQIPPSRLPLPSAPLSPPAHGFRYQGFPQRAAWRIKEKTDKGSKHSHTWWEHWRRWPSISSTSRWHTYIFSCTHGGTLPWMRKFKSFSKMNQRWGSSLPLHFSQSYVGQLGRWIWSTTVLLLLFSLSVVSDSLWPRP